MSKVSQKALKSRSEPIRDVFTALGCQALESVITGRISHSRAINSLLQLRDLMLDKDGDLARYNKVRHYFLRNRISKGVYFGYLHGATDEDL